jgi:hypothetical protein
MTGSRLKRSARPTDHITMEPERGHSGWWDLAAALYVAGTGIAALCTVGWAMAPFENVEDDTGSQAALVVFAALSLVAGWRMAVAVWSGDSIVARVLLVASLVSLAVWARLLFAG